MSPLSGTVAPKKWLVRFLRSARFQPLWELVHHAGLVGMNYWGGASLHQSGEKGALRHVRRRTLAQRPVVIFDVGANVGEYAVEAIRTFGPDARVFCFEPSAAAFRALVERTKADPAVRALNFGLSDVAAVRELSGPDPGSVRGSLHPVGGAAVGPAGSFAEAVTLETLDDFCRREGIEHVHLLKIDVEGHEYRVLSGAKRMLEAGQVRFIQFEFGDRDIDSRTFFRDFYNLLSERYEIYRIVPNGLRRIGRYTSELEIFATINYLAESRSA